MKSICRFGIIMAAFGLVIASGTSALAQTVPPGASAPVPVLPASDTPPPNTDIPAALSDVPIEAVVFAYFGPYAVVFEFLLPQRVRAAAPVGCWSAPNATPQEESSAVLFGEKPAGTEFIVFFARGTRLYVFDTSFGNYCWIDNAITRS